MADSAESSTRQLLLLLKHCCATDGSEEDLKAACHTFGDIPHHTSITLLCLTHVLGGHHTFSPVTSLFQALWTLAGATALHTTHDRHTPASVSQPSYHLCCQVYSTWGFPCKTLESNTIIRPVGLYLHTLTMQGPTPTSHHHPTQSAQQDIMTPTPSQSRPPLLLTCR